MYLCHMNAHEFVEKVSAYAKANGLISAGDNVIVTLSGGADSVALLRVLHAMKVNCHALHCNFGLRGEESDRDESFVRSLCDRMQIPLDVKHFDVAQYEQEHKVSTEMACRELRYAWFEQIRNKLGFKAIAVAHHHDDNVETFFLNILRGTGIQGLAGIKPRNRTIVRPLLCVTRKDIEGYLQDLQQVYVIDHTNLENDYKRNKIRNVLIPAMTELFPNAHAGIERTMNNVQGCNDFYQYSVNKLREISITGDENDIVRISFEPLLEMLCRRETAVFELIKPYGFNSQDAVEINKALNHICDESRVYLSGKYKAVLKKYCLEIVDVEKEKHEEYCVNLNDLLSGDDDRLPFAVSLEKQVQGAGRISGIDGKCAIALNVKILEDNPDVVLRHWKEGDRMYPFGMKGSKLVSDLFRDEKYTEAMKRKAWLLATADNQILWILTLRSSSKYPVSPQDTTYLKLYMK